MLLQGLIGIVAFPLIAWSLSEDRARADIRTILIGVAIQIGLAGLLLGVPVVKDGFLALNGVVNALMDATRAGTSFVFGYIGGATAPFPVSGQGTTFNLAFQALPLILVVSALSALLFHWRILPKIVESAAWLLGRTFKIGGALGIGVAANVFVGMVESPLLVKPYLKHLKRGELFVLMTAGMATVAGTVMVLYASIIGPVIPGSLGHILTASVLSAPAAITIAQLMVPLDAPTPGKIDIPKDGNAMAAITRGTMDGVGLLINVVAMLLVAVALIALLESILGLLPEIGSAPLTLERVFGWVMSPFAFAMGIPWAEAQTAGGLLGTKTVLNEFLAYLQLAAMDDATMTERSRLIMTYALCGFANFGSLGIMIGGMTTMCPERRDEIIALGGRTIISGTLATCMTGAVAGLFF
ncbi:MAG: nucleoside:proton symporter [Rhodospirillales bacterium]|nr:nucleoside:proton symporter [Rhodospirillales bacterium]MBO6787919.1 nucleoside:proton symporter [Rhodospirillales bacterium]